MVLPSAGLIGYDTPRSADNKTGNNRTCIHLNCGSIRQLPASCVYRYLPNSNCFAMCRRATVTPNQAILIQVEILRRSSYDTRNT